MPPGSLYFTALVSRLSSAVRSNAGRPAHGARWRGRHLADRAPPFLRQHRGVLQDFPQHGSEIHRFRAAGINCPASARDEQQQAAGDAVEPLGFLEQAAEHLLLPRPGFAACKAFSELAAHDGERGLQLVRGIGAEAGGLVETRPPSRSIMRLSTRAEAVDFRILSGHAECADPTRAK